MDSQHRNDDGMKETDTGVSSSDERQPASESMPERAKSHGAASAKKGGASKEIVEWIKALVIAVVLVFFIRMFLFEPFIVDGPSMEPNFESGERLIVNKILYSIREPRFGEVVVFDVPEQGRKFIKRVIGVSGDKIRVEGDDLYINDVKVEEPYIAEAIEAAKAAGGMYNGNGPRYNFPNDTVTEMTVPEGAVFAMGDHRDNSTDSRMIGFVKDDEIVGRADVIFWPLNKLEFIKHKY
ncbi:S26 family signal peptidase [Paenibacillus agaridevorans]|jgi:signal peptidase I|uniref:Signal peptidase I n=2 Tax=Paenibacillus TaxID=44249 RepID=A0A2R5ESB0_9BACL|nr:signal peptidase I [Paenibacillus sp. PAMC21692]GBG09572.1 S26 family signal peptidase [Paenibacillus agaridevorans]